MKVYILINKFDFENDYEDLDTFGLGLLINKVFTDEDKAINEIANNPNRYSGIYQTTIEK